MLIAVILLSVFLTLSICALVACYFVMDTQFSKIEKYENWISEFNVRLQDTYKKMRAIDNNNIFSRDDEVGVAFTQILNLIESIKDKVK